MSRQSPNACLYEGNSLPMDLRHKGGQLKFISDGRESMAYVLHRQVLIPRSLRALFYLIHVLSKLVPSNKEAMLDHWRGKFRANLYLLGEVRAPLSIGMRVGLVPHLHLTSQR